VCAASVRVAPLSSLGVSVSLFRRSRWSFGASPCPGRAAIEQLAPVYACVMGVCLQLAAYAAWSLLRSVGSCKRVLRVGARRGGGRSLRIKRQSGAA
jgi:hypothetical protein